MAYRLKFIFYNDDLPYDVTHCNLIVKGKRADGVVVTDRGVVTEEGAAYYDVKAAMYTVSGDLSLEVALVTPEGGYVTTQELMIAVREGYGEGELAEEDVTPLLTELENKVKAVSVAVERAEKAALAVEDIEQKESDRETAEQVRKEAEDDRAAAEEQRSFAEIERNEAEVIRVNTETLRAEAEAERVSAEAVRQSAYEQMDNTFANAIKGSASGASVRAPAENISSCG